jgi:hypothetical protein
VAILLVLLSVGLTTTGLLVVLLVALIRHLKLLSSSVREFSGEVDPLLKDISEGGATAQRRLAGLSEKAEARRRGSRRGRSRRGPGARIRG